MLRTLDMTSKFVIVSAQITLCLQTMLHTYLALMFMIYPHTKFYTPNSNRSLVMAIDPKASQKRVRL